MAAGALVSLRGGTNEQIGHAVAMALKNLMGLVCDPMAGLVEVGRRMPVEFRETVLGGLAATPTGRAVKERMPKGAQ